MNIMDSSFIWWAFICLFIILNISQLICTHQMIICFIHLKRIFMNLSNAFINLISAGTNAKDWHLSEINICEEQNNRYLAIVNFLEKTDLQLEISAHQLKIVAQRLTEAYYPENTVVFQYCQKAENIYFILEGSIIIYSYEGVEILTLDKYKYFGEMEVALGLRTHRVTVVTSDKPCKFLVLSKDDYLDLAQYQLFERSMMEIARNRYELLLITGLIK